MTLVGVPVSVLLYRPRPNYTLLVLAAIRKPRLAEANRGFLIAVLSLEGFRNVYGNLSVRLVNVY